MSIINILKELSPHFINFTTQGLKYGPQGKMLLKNLEEQWFLHCITMSRYNMFLSDEFNDTINFITSTEMSDIPFGLATIKNSKYQWDSNILSIQKSNYHRTAETAIFNNDAETKDLFYKIQKERKIWWRKLAQNPSRFKLSEAKKIKNYTIVDIEAQFSFGNLTLERITYHTDVQKLFSQVFSFFFKKLILTFISLTSLKITIIFMDHFIFRLIVKKILSTYKWLNKECL